MEFDVDFPKVSEVSYDSVTCELLREIDELVEYVDAQRPFDDDVVKSITEELRGRNVYNSSGIEGSTLTLRESVEILKSGSSIDVGRKREATEAINLGKAIEHVQGLVDRRVNGRKRTSFVEPTGF